MADDSPETSPSSAAAPDVLTLSPFRVRPVSCSTLHLIADIAVCYIVQHWQDPHQVRRSS